MGGGTGSQGPKRQSKVKTRKAQSETRPAFAGKIAASLIFALCLFSVAFPFPPAIRHPPHFPSTIYCLPRSL